MPLRLDSRDLEPHEKRIVMMRASGASNNEIAAWLETSSVEVGYVLSRPRCSQALLKLQAMMGTSMAPAIEDMAENMKAYAARAFQVETENMERLHDWAGTEETKLAIRAASAACLTAQDILDRTGNRAPTKVINANIHAVSPQTIEHLADVLREVKGGEVNSREEDRGTR